MLCHDARHVILSQVSAKFLLLIILSWLMVIVYGLVWIHSSIHDPLDQTELY